MSDGTGNTNGTPKQPLPENLYAVLKAAYQNDSHKCLTKAAEKLAIQGLVKIVKVSPSGLTCEIVSTPKTKDALILKMV